MNLCVVTLKMSTSRLPRTDVASDVMNRMIENHLRCYVSYHQNDWDELLPAAEFAYNSAVTEDLGISPFEMDLGQNPKSPLDVTCGAEVPVERIEALEKRLKSSLENSQYLY